MGIDVGGLLNLAMQQGDCTPHLDEWGDFGVEAEVGVLPGEPSGIEVLGFIPVQRVSFCGEHALHEKDRNECDGECEPAQGEFVDVIRWVSCGRGHDAAPVCRIYG